MGLINFCKGTVAGDFIKRHLILSHLDQCFSTDGSWNFPPKIQQTVLMAQSKKILLKKIKM